MDDFEIIERKVEALNKFGDFQIREVAPVLPLIMPFKFILMRRRKIWFIKFWEPVDGTKTAKEMIKLLSKLTYELSMNDEGSDK